MEPEQLAPELPASEPVANAPRRRRGPIIATATVAIAALLLGGAGLGTRAVWLAFHPQSTSDASDQKYNSRQPGHQVIQNVDSELGINVTDATDEQQVGVVTILTDLYYDGYSAAAGTGIILSSSGEVLTNNHVIEGATNIEVTVESTGETYEADLVGTDSTNDVALLQLRDAHGLDTATLDLTSEAQVGDEASSIGNAEGTGDLVVATGEITSTGESLDIGNDDGSSYESLDNLIELHADVVGGDSGGPLVDEDNEVIGMITAASTGYGDIYGYAITIGDAMKIITQIQAGDDSGTVRLGPSPFLGVELADDQPDEGVLISDTIDGMPAADAGLKSGDTILSVDGVAVNAPEELSSEIRSHSVGDSVDVVYLDEDGAQHTITVELGEGPA